MITLRNLCMYDEALHAYACGVADVWTRVVVGWHILWCRQCHARVVEHRRLRAVIASGYGFAATARPSVFRPKRFATLVLAAVALTLLAALAAGNWDDIKGHLPWIPKESCEPVAPHQSAKALPPALPSRTKSAAKAQPGPQPHTAAVPFEHC